MAANNDPVTMNELLRALRLRRRVLLNEILHKIRDVRADATDTCRQSSDPDDPGELDPEEDVAFALIQIKSQVLSRIDEALHRFDAGTYGTCTDCDGAIAPIRLQALPFATRCVDCETRREFNELEQRTRARRGGTPAFAVRH
jgi:DnaK suppressor protein